MAPKHPVMSHTCDASNRDTDVTSLPALFTRGLMIFEFSGDNLKRSISLCLTSLMPFLRTPSKNLSAYLANRL